MLRTLRLGYFRQFTSSQLDSQSSCQIVKFKKNLLSLYSSFLYTAAFPAQPATHSPNKQALTLQGFPKALDFLEKEFFGIHSP
jgi:hypothetical protein